MGPGPARGRSRWTRGGRKGVATRHGREGRKCVSLPTTVSTEPELTRADAAPPALTRSATVVAIAGALALVLLALAETAQALIAPARAPSGADWLAAAAEVRAGFRAGDLIVAAPAWADPLARMHLGDLMTVAMDARMDDARYGRVWEISQRGARAPEARGPASARHRFGALTVRLVERAAAATVTYDFLAHWKEARVTRRTSPEGAPLACAWQGDRFACPRGGTVRRELVEVDTRIREALLAPAPADPSAVLAIEFPAVSLGRELVVMAGLHDVWARKYGRGTVNVEVWMDGQLVTGAAIGNRSGWRPIRVDTSARDGQIAPVRVQISSREPAMRNLAFAAEARR